MRLDLPISLGDKSSDETDYRDQLLVNLTVVERKIKGDDGYLLSHPGLTSFGAGVGIDRGGIYNSRQRAHLRVSKQRLVSVDTSGVSTEIGVISGTNQVSLPYSFQTQGIVADGRFWLYDGTTFQEVIDPDLGSPIDADWINGVYFLTDGENLYHTRSDDETAIDPQTFATSEFSPDRTLGVLKNKQNQMVVFNRFSTEWFVDQATDNFRFRRVEGKAVKVGIVGTHAKCEMDGQIFILGNRKEESPSIHILASGTENTIATREIDQILETYTESELSDAVLESRVEKRQKYVLVRLSNHSLLYNYSIAQKFGNKYAWTILKTDIQGDNPWRARNGVYDPRVSKWIYGDNTDSRLGSLDDTTNLQYEEEIEEIFYTPIVNLETQSINQFEVDTLPGFSPGDVRAFFSMSYDGVTYGQEYTMTVSEQFNYNLRLILRRLGYIRENFNIKMRIVANGRSAFSGGRIDYD